MSANPIDAFTARAGARETGIVDGAFRMERRNRARTRVHWPLVLLADDGQAIETVTHNLSSSGFYCFVPSPLTPGGGLICTLKVPVYDPKNEEGTLTLECKAQVLRVEAVAEDSFGIACRIEDYRLMKPGPRLA